jgi:hypothetical protein
MRGSYAQTILDLKPKFLPLSSSVQLRGVRFQKGMCLEFRSCKSNVAWAVLAAKPGSGRSF